MVLTQNLCLVKEILLFSLTTKNAHGIFVFKKKSPLIVDTQFRDSAHKPLGPILTSYSKVFYTFVVILSSTIRPLKTLQIHGYIRRPLAVRMLGWRLIWSNFEFMISYHARGSFLQLYRTLKRAFNCIMSSGCPSDQFRSHGGRIHKKLASGGHKRVFWGMTNNTKQTKTIWLEQYNYQ